MQNSFFDNDAPDFLTPTQEPQESGKASRFQVRSRSRLIFGILFIGAGAWALLARLGMAPDVETVFDIIGGALADTIEYTLPVGIIAGGAFLLYRAFTAPDKQAQRYAGTEFVASEPDGKAQPQPAPETQSAATGAPESQASAAQGASASEKTGWQAKRLTRSMQRRKFLGIAAGLSDYFNIDVAFIRIAFVVLALATKGGFVALYWLLGFVIPADEQSRSWKWRYKSHHSCHKPHQRIYRF